MFLDFGRKLQNTLTLKILKVTFDLFVTYLLQDINVSHCFTLWPVLSLSFSKYIITLIFDTNLQTNFSLFFTQSFYECLQVSLNDESC